MSVIVTGQIGRDLVLRVDAPPGTNGSAPVAERLEMLGGKAANQAVGLAQLGVPVALAGVVGDDAEGTAALDQAERDGIDVDRVVRRGCTSLVVSEIDRRANRRLLEHFPEESWLEGPDLEVVLHGLGHEDVLLLQLQQPDDFSLAAAREARSRGAVVVTDGAPARSTLTELFGMVDVARVDAEEARLVAGEPIDSVSGAIRVGRTLLELGPRWVAIEVPDVGDVMVAGDGVELHRHGDGPILDRTGAGDAFVAGVTAALWGGLGPAEAGQLGSAAAGATVGHLGGRPDLGGLADGLARPG